jgi:hypothetical protein
MEMGFGLNIGNGGDFLPIIKIDGKDGGVERTTWDGQNKGVETVDSLVALFDFATLKVGWVEFTDKGPDKRLVAIGDPLPDKPGEKFKQGIQLVVLLPGGLGCHEICTTASGVLGALESVYDTATVAPEWNDGKVPVVQLTEFKKEKTKHGARAIPVFQILDWKDRPAELEAHKATPKPRAAMPSQNRPAETGSTQMTPPPAAKPAMAAVPDFG